MRRFHDEEREAQQRDNEVPIAAPVSTAARMIALQRTAGNHAVAALIAREAAPKPEPAHALAIVEGLGSIPLIAVAVGDVHKSADREKPQTTRDIPVVSKQGEFSQALALASQRGDVFEVELFIGEKLHLKLHKAMISLFSVSDGHGGEGPVDSWTLNAESIEFVADQR